MPKKSGPEAGVTGGCKLPCVLEPNPVPLREWHALFLSPYFYALSPAHMSVHHAHALCPKRPKERVRPLRTGVIDDFESLRMYSESNLSPLEKQCP